MSIFVRPASPPPRQPSPDIPDTLLTSLPVRPRSRPPSTIRQSDRSIHSVRSLDHLADKASDNSLRKSKSRGILKASPPHTPVTLPTLSPPRSPSIRSQNRRSLSCAVPYRSPPASPTLTAPPPPVPPIPAFVLNPSDKKSLPPVYLSEVHCVSPAPSSTLASVNTRRKSHAERPSQANVGMTCARFFSMCNSNRSVTATCTV